MKEEVGSGSNSMSDAWMPFQPAIDEPSKKCPDSNFSGPKDFTGTLTCCSLPRVSVKRRSTNLTSLSLIVWNISFAVIIFPYFPCPFETGIYSYLVRGREINRKWATFCHKQKKPSTPKCDRRLP